MVDSLGIHRRTAFFVAVDTAKWYYCRKPAFISAQKAN